MSGCRSSIAPTPTPVPTADTEPEPWTSITWRKLAPADPIATFQRLVRVEGGWLAIAQPVGTDKGSYTPLWHSSDGRGWTELGAATLGANSVVLKPHRFRDLVVLLTLNGDENACPQTQLAECWRTRPPLRTWTSTDGLEWTLRAEPMNLPVPAGRSLLSRPASAANGNVIAITYRDANTTRLALSHDGVTWQTANPPPAFTTGYAQQMTSVGGRLVAVGFVGDQPTDVPLVAWSLDGLSWQTASELPAGEFDVGILAVGRSVVVIRASASNGAWAWWISDDGDRWKLVEDFAPLGTSPDLTVLPNGELVGDGDRLVAYAWDHTAAWSSFDGQAWDALEIRGDKPELIAGSLRLLPVGLLLADERGAWFGEPSTD